MSKSIDFEAEGLLAGLSGRELEGRRELLEQLVEQGVELDDIREAAAEGRLTVVAVEREIAGLARYTAEELSERSGVELDLIVRNWQALGVAVPGTGEKVFTETDLEAAHQLRAFVDSGIPPEMVIDSSRVMALTMSQFAASNRELVIQLAGDDVGEAELSRRFSEMARTLMPMIGPTLEHAYRLQLREQIRHAMIVAGGPGSNAEGEQAAVAFADLVGFTTLGERVNPTELGAISARLAELASEVAGGPIRLVKMLGDGLLFVSADLKGLVAAMLNLVEAADEEPEGFPPLRAGVAWGPLMSSGGDYYGRVVNRASRVSEIARASSVLVTELVQEQLADEDFDFRYAGRKNLKGVQGTVHVYRVRRPKRDD